MTTPEPTTEAARNAMMAAELAAELREPRWIVMAHFGIYGVSGSDPVTTFLQACGEYASLAGDHPAQVWEMNFANNTMYNVTEDVEAALAARRGAR